MQIYLPGKPVSKIYFLKYWWIAAFSALDQRVYRRSVQVQATHVSVLYSELPLTFIVLKIVG